MNGYSDDSSFRERHALLIVGVLTVVLAVVYGWTWVAPRLASVVAVFP